MNTEEIKEQLLQPKVIAGMLIAFLVAAGGTQLFMNNYVYEEPAFNQTEVINNGSAIGENSTHVLYAKCTGNRTADQIKLDRLNASWVTDECWFTEVEKQNKTTESNDFQLG